MFRVFRSPDHGGHPILPSWFFRHLCFLPVLPDNRGCPMRPSGTLKSVFANIDGEAWLRFAIALLGLALAFIAALLSTIARESGNLLATVLFASTALLLAGMVGVVVVPYLTKRVVAGRVRDALDFEIT